MKNISVKEEAGWTKRKKHESMVKAIFPVKQEKQKRDPLDSYNKQTKQTKKTKKEMMGRKLDRSIFWSFIFMFYKYLFYCTSLSHAVYLHSL